MTDAVQHTSVLVVDDDTGIQMLLREVFRHRQLNMIAATQLEAAEKALRSHEFDIVLADINLRGILASEGLELLTFIKRNWPRTKVLIMTGQNSPAIRQEARERGADYYYEKPFDIVEIQKVVDNIGTESMQRHLERFSDPAGTGRADDVRCQALTATQYMTRRRS